MMLNCTITGRAGGDFEIKTPKSGKQYGEISVAVNKPEKDKNGEWASRTIWVSVKSFSEASWPSLLSRAKRGVNIVATGELDVKTYQSKSGETKLDVSLLANKIEAITFKEEGQGDSQSTNKPTSNAQSRQDMDDDIPF